MSSNHVRILDVGQCDYDHGQISRLLTSNFKAEIDRAHTIEDALSALQATCYDLVLVNRVFDRDGSAGLDFLKHMKSDAALRDTPVMLVSNYTDAQDAAVAAGALRGFGKSALNDPETVSTLSRALQDQPRPAIPNT